jgi:NADH dehydrogenase (ubiquinone) flavoprotein 2
MLSSLKNSFTFVAKSFNIKTVRAFSRYNQHRDTPNNNDSVPFEFSKENYQEINKVLSRYPSNYKMSAVIPLLHIAQKQNDNFLSIAAMNKIAKILEISEMAVYEVATFYTMFNREKVGKYHLQICGTTPCMLCGSREVTHAIEEYVGCKLGETSPDGLFTLEEVECLGACANAPMIQVNGEWVYEDLTPENVIPMLEKFKNGEQPVKGPQNGRNRAEGPQGRTTLINHNPEGLVERDFAAAKKEWEAAREAAKQAAAAKK